MNPRLMLNEFSSTFHQVKVYNKYYTHYNYYDNLIYYLDPFDLTLYAERINISFAVRSVICD